jgi:uncharacterized protein
LIYFDTAYLAKCYLNEPGSVVVREFLCKTGGRAASSALARAELPAVFHRHLREGNLSPTDYQIVLNQYASDIQSEVWDWLPLHPDLWSRIDGLYRDLSADVFLRAADAIHLLTAREFGFTELYTNDRHLLRACAALGIHGKNLL